MPLYEYRCEACGHRFEILQRMGESGEGLACPECSALRLAKEHSTFAAAGGAAKAASPAGCCRGTPT